jgi:hypothetical protein
VTGKFAETAAVNLFSTCSDVAIAGREVERFVAVSRRCDHAERMPRGCCSFLTSANFTLLAACSTEEAQAVMTC